MDVGMDSRQVLSWALCVHSLLTAIFYDFTNSSRGPERRRSQPRLPRLVPHTAGSQTRLSQVPKPVSVPCVAAPPKKRSRAKINSGKVNLVAAKTQIGGAGAQGPCCRNEQERDECAR